MGVGITAGCMATLKPLLKPCLAHFGITSTNPSGSAMPWSRSRRAGLASDQPLDNLRPTADKVITTTTVTGRRASDDSSKMGFFDGMKIQDEERGWPGGISKAVTTTITEERRNQSRTESRARSGSSNSISTVEEALDEDTRKAAKVYERF